MVIESIVGFIVACLFLVKCANYAVKSLTDIARALHIKEFVISFMLVGIVSSLPEASVAIFSSIEGDPSIGFGALMGSNIADLSIVLGLIVLIGGRVRVKSEFVYQEMLHVALILIPFILAYDGVLSRLDGMVLILLSLFFILHLLKRRYEFTSSNARVGNKAVLAHGAVFLASIAGLMLSAHFVFKFTEDLSAYLALPTVTIALIVIGLGTCLPEFMFAVRSMRKHKDDLALGDILGNVIIDATLILGITALISPIIISRTIIFITGAFTVLLVAMTLSLLGYKRALSQSDGILLVFLYVIFVIVGLTARTLA